MANEITKTVVTAVIPGFFRRKIGNTTFVVSVLFSEKTTESMDDKILRLVESDIHQGEARQCN